MINNPLSFDDPSGFVPGPNTGPSRQRPEGSLQPASSTGTAPDWGTLESVLEQVPGILVTGIRNRVPPLDETATNPEEGRRGPCETQLGGVLTSGGCEATSSRQGEGFATAGAMAEQHRQRPAAAQRQEETLHRYRLPVPNSCTPEESFDALKSPGASAPGAPAAVEGTTGQILPGVIPWLSFLPFDLTHSNPIDQVVDTPNLTIVNIARDGHIFCPGTVHTFVRPKSNGSLVTTVGLGTGEYGNLNILVGQIFFGGRNLLLSMGCEAKHGEPLSGPIFDLR